MKSIMQDTKECFLCRRFYNSDNVRNLEEHHVFFGSANRRLSEKYGLKVWLCNWHHTGSEYSVHQDKRTDMTLKVIGQEEFEKHHTREEFRNIFGRSYIY